jgi:serine/threonine protein kinase
MATLMRIVDEQPAAMAALVPELPSWFSHIVERLLSKDPAQRFATASEVSQLLEQCLSHLQQPTKNELPTFLCMQQRSLQQTAIDGSFTRRANGLTAEGSRKDNALRRQGIQIRCLEPIDRRLRFSRRAFACVVAEILNVDEEDIRFPGLSCVGEEQCGRRRQE